MSLESVFEVFELVPDTMISPSELNQGESDPYISKCAPPKALGESFHSVPGENIVVSIQKDPIARILDRIGVPDPDEEKFTEQSSGKFVITEYETHTTSDPNEKWKELLEKGWKLVEKTDNSVKVKREVEQARGYRSKTHNAIAMMRLVDPEKTEEIAKGMDFLTEVVNRPKKEGERELESDRENRETILRFAQAFKDPPTEYVPPPSEAEALWSLYHSHPDVLKALKVSGVTEFSCKDQELRKVLHAVVETRGWFSASFLNTKEESETRYTIKCKDCNQWRKYPDGWHIQRPTYSTDCFFARCKNCWEHDFECYGITFDNLSELEDEENVKKFQDKNRLIMAPTIERLFACRDWGSRKLKIFKKRIQWKQENWGFFRINTAPVPLRICLPTT